MRKRPAGVLYDPMGQPFSDDQIALIATFGDLDVEDVVFIVGLTMMALRAREASDNEEGIAEVVRPISEGRLVAPRKRNPGKAEA